MMAAVDDDWNGGVPYSMVIAPGGLVFDKGNGALDILKTRRLVPHVADTAPWKNMPRARGAGRPANVVSRCAIWDSPGHAR